MKNSRIDHLFDYPFQKLAVLLEGTAPAADLKPLEWCLFRGHVYFRPEPNKLPDHYKLTQTGEKVGVTLYRVQHVVVDGLIVQGYQLDGVNVHDLVESCELSALTCRGNGRSGISIGGASRVLISGGLIGDNGRAQIRIESPAAASVETTEVVDNTAPAFVVRGGGLLVDGKPFQPNP